MEHVRIPIPDISFSPPVYLCPRAKTTFILDGNIEKPFWESIPFTDYFVDIEGDKREAPRYSTRVKMAWDDENFYVGALLEGDEIWATLTQRDCVIFQDNDFEIFIDPDSDTHQYFEFEMNALGTVWDLMLTKPYRDFGGVPVNGWDIQGLLRAVHIDGTINQPDADNKRWMAEVVIPFRALKEGAGGKTPNPGDYYRVNFSRVHWRVDQSEGAYKKLPGAEDNWVWSPTGLINIHYPELWGFVFFCREQETYEIPADELLKWQLRRLYYAQHSYYDRHGAFTPELNDLLADLPEFPKLPGLAVETTAHSFEMRCQSSDRMGEISIYSDGKVWNHENITPEGCLEYLYRYMPDSDRADYPENLYLKFAQHAYMVKNTVAWGRRIPLEIFQDYVLPYRVNNENIEFYKEDFFQELYPRVCKLSMYDAAVEVNYWCYEKATYHSTDIRTASPFTVIRNAYGRCGEESVLTVAAMRSVGIPSRQCYTPRWAHCDDNHAWVEVWIDGDWHFLGACEPEPKLDRGWFALPASKAMLIHNKVLCKHVTNEVITNQTDDMTEINRLSHYAKTKEIAVQVCNAQGEPVKGAIVRFEVVNFSEFFPLATMETDEKGEAYFLTGLGDLMVYASYGQLLAFEKMDVRTQGRLQLVLGEACHKEAVTDYRFVPPEGGITPPAPLGQEMEEAHKKKMKRAQAVRKAYEQTFFKEKYIASLGSSFDPYTKEVAECLVHSRGNWKELLRFLEGDERTLLYRLRLLQSLSRKDLTDIRGEVLQEHLQYAMEFSKDYSEELFCGELLCPRIWMEQIYPYRKEIREFFGADRLLEFKNSPALLEDWIKEHISDCTQKTYHYLSTSPGGLLKFGSGNEISRKILFTAVMRTAGVPAKLYQADLSCMYYQDGQWKRLEEEQKSDREAVLTLVSELGERFEYLSNYSVSVWTEEGYETLDFKGMAWTGETITYGVPSGSCRVVVSERLADGTNMVRVYDAQTQAGRETRLFLTIPKEENHGLQIPLTNMTYETMDGETRHLYEELSESDSMIMWLLVGEEPTEHLLNELLEASEDYGGKKPSILLLLTSYEDLEHVTLQQVLQAIPFIKVGIGYKKEELDYLYGSFGIKDQRLPLSVVAKGSEARFAWSGYRVGIGKLLLKCLD